MKILKKFVFFLLFIFFLNITFYYISNDYRNFIENLKYSEKKLENEFENNLDLQKIENNLEEKIEEKIEKEEKIERKTILWKNYKIILDKFKKDYLLKKIEVNSLLFELTDEYPDYYFEYYSKDLVLYFFPTKRYWEIYDIFDYLKNNSPYKINETNNFWDKSFYINLNEEIKDDYIRIVVSKNGINFWLKIKKDEYNKVKEILLWL